MFSKVLHSNGTFQSELLFPKMELMLFDLEELLECDVTKVTRKQTRCLLNGKESKH